MTEMMPKERIEKFFNREPVDRMPCFSGMGMVTVQAIEQMGIRFAEVHTSAEHMALSAMTTAELFGFDSVVIPYDMCTVWRSSDARMAAASRDHWHHPPIGDCGVSTG